MATSIKIKKWEDYIEQIPLSDLIYIMITTSELLGAQYKTDMKNFVQNHNLQLTDEYNTYIDVYLIIDLGGSLTALQRIYKKAKTYSCFHISYIRR